MSEEHPRAIAARQREAQRQERAARLAQELRRNLARRKGQARARAEDQPTPTPPDSRSGD